MGTSFFNKLDYSRRFVTTKATDNEKPATSRGRRLPGPVVVDLFAGCGGLSAGLELAGFHPVYVNELVDDARESYLLNRDHLITGPSLRDRFNSSNIKELIENDGAKLDEVEEGLKETWGIEHGDIDLVTGGPPCQGFSGIGIRRSYSVDKDQLPSNHLFQDMAYVVAKLNPRMFLFENVRGLLNARWKDGGEKGEIWKQVQKTFASIPGYTTKWKLIRAGDYGVPQNRPRVLLVGIRDDVAKDANWDPDSSQNENAPAYGLLPTPTGEPAPNLVDVLGDLIDDDESNWKGGKTYHYPSEANPLNEIQTYFRTGLDGTMASNNSPLTEHEYSKHSDHINRKFQAMIDNDGIIPEEMRTKKFAQRLLPEKWGPEGPTITATSLPDDFVHFAQPRILKVREWARLQTFPDRYQFAGKRTTGGIRRAGNPREGMHDRELPKYTQIGNSVPVLLAKAVGLHFRTLLKH